MPACLARLNLAMTYITYVRTECTHIRVTVCACMQAAAAASNQIHFPSHHQHSNVFSILIHKVCLEAAINATQHVQVISGDWYRPPGAHYYCAAITAQHTQGSGQGSLNAI